MIETIQKTPEKIVLITDMEICLANAIRRSVNEIPIVAVEDVDIYKNDSALYDPIIAHRIGLIPLKQEKLRGSKTPQLKLSVVGGEVLSKELGKDVAYEEIPIVLLGKNQELELVAKCKTGFGREHSKFSPGLFYYRHLPSIQISGEGEKQSELAEIYPKVFEFNEKLKVKNEWACEIDSLDIEKFRGVEINFTKNLVVFIESWGQIKVEDIFIEAMGALKDNLTELSKELK